MYVYLAFVVVHPTWLVFSRTPSVYAYWCIYSSVTSLLVHVVNVITQVHIQYYNTGIILTNPIPQAPNAASSTGGS